MTKRARVKRDALATDPRNLQLVVEIAKRIHVRLPSCFDLGDLISVGHVALLRLAAQYSPATQLRPGTPFSAYARQGIRGAILNSVSRNKYVEATRPSIDDPGSRPSSPPKTQDRGEGDLRFDTEASRGLARMATQPGVEISIDRARRCLQVSEAISWLPANLREILKLWYSPEEPSPRQVARRLRISPEAAEALHARAIAGLQARLSGRACARAGLELSKAA